mmetsp:Transcript_98303/g.169395  ORF Transcript_98303/g.169395 Transcript_98303/m.169395 type:complete len:244 (+) Transcript_98303:419-1150(+)
MVVEGEVPVLLVGHPFRLVAVPVPPQVAQEYVVALVKGGEGGGLPSPTAYPPVATVQDAVLEVYDAGGPGLRDPVHEQRVPVLRLAERPFVGVALLEDAVLRLPAVQAVRLEDPGRGQDVPPLPHVLNVRRQAEPEQVLPHADPPVLDERKQGREDVVEAPGGHLVALRQVRVAQVALDGHGGHEEHFVEVQHQHLHLPEERVPAAVPAGHGLQKDLHVLVLIFSIAVRGEVVQGHAAAGRGA